MCHIILRCYLTLNKTVTIVCIYHAIDKLLREGCRRGRKSAISFIICHLICQNDSSVLPCFVSYYLFVFVLTLGEITIVGYCWTGKI